MNYSVRPVLFVGNARDYHTIDCIRALSLALEETPWLFATDCIESEAHIRIARESDNLLPLFIIDSLLLQDQSGLAHKWRNFLKLVLLPIQVILLLRLVHIFKPRTIHAHTFYYGLLCRLAGLNFFLTPQGAELTERPYKSLGYRLLMRFTLAGASHVFVDSERMRLSANSLGCQNVSVIQYGVDTGKCLSEINTYKRSRLLSVRGIEEIYQIDSIQKARDLQLPSQPISFAYPIWDSQYHARFKSNLKSFDQNLGRVSKDNLYALLKTSLLVISIPTTDSSPRSVYEAIFSGCPVATTYSRWIEALPQSMRSRLIVVDIQSDSWLADALCLAEEILHVPFEPTTKDIETYDQFATARRTVRDYYKIAS